MHSNCPGHPFSSQKHIKKGAEGFFSEKKFARLKQACYIRFHCRIQRIAATFFLGVKEIEIKAVFETYHQEGQDTMANTPGFNNGLNDPMNMRNTDTGTMQRVNSATPELKTAPVGRKTLKLKPITPKAPVAVPPPKSVSAPSASPIPASPSDTTTAATPAQTGTVPVSRIRKPATPTTADSPTADIPMPGAVPSSASSSVPPTATATATTVSPSSVPGVKQTIKLRPSTSGAHSTQVSLPGITDSVQAPQVQQKPASAQTIKLTPKSENETNSSTARIAKQTIKLVPPSHDAPSGASGAAATSSGSAPTIKLAPQQGGGAASAAPTPSSPTIKLGSGSVSPSASTVKLTPGSAVSPSSPTIKLGAGGGAAAAPASSSASATIKLTPAGSAASATEQPHKLSLKKHDQPAAVPPSVANPPPAVAAANAAVGKEKAEPSILFTISAVAALLVVLFGAFMMFAQYSNIWNGTDISVPGLERTSK